MARLASAVDRELTAAGGALASPAVPVVAIVPAVVLVVVALVTWRFDRRLLADADALAGSADRLASLRSAVAALRNQVEDTGRRHGRLAGEDPEGLT